MPFCSECGLKETRNRRLCANTKICDECTAEKADQETVAESDEMMTQHILNSREHDDKSLAELKFSDLKEWFQAEMNTGIKKAVRSEMSDQMRTVKNQLATLEENIDVTKQSIKTSEENMIKMMNEKIKKVEEKAAAQTDVHATQQKYLETIDKEKRSKNLVFLGIAEADVENEENRYEADKETIEEILQLIEVDDSVDIKTIKRLGRLKDRDENDDDERQQKRPLLVTVDNEEMRDHALLNAKKLKDVAEGEPHHKVFIKKDEHPAHRREMKRLYDAWKTEKEKPDNVGKEVIFDRRKKEIRCNGKVFDQYQVPRDFQ